MDSLGNCPICEREMLKGPFSDKHHFLPKMKDTLADGTPRFKILKPPHRAEKTRTGLFLGGSIEMGKALDWQEKVTEQIKFMNVEIYNPRRDDWDSTWKQSIASPKFNEQVTWELDHLEMADVILMYFDPNTIAPISLMELGLSDKFSMTCNCVKITHGENKYKNARSRGM